MSAPVRSAAAIAFLLLSTIMVACSDAVAPAGTALPTAAPTATAAVTPSTPTAAPSPLGTQAPPATSSAFSGELIRPGSLVICSSFPRTRFAEYDAAGQPFGVDVEIDQAIADVLAIQSEIVDVPFDELIDAVVDRQCDVSVAGQFITQDRLARIDMIPYREGALKVIVPEGNPLGIDESTDLCGRSFAVVAATVYVDMVRGAGDYVGESINDQCLDAGVAPVDLREFPDQQKAEAALSAGDVDAYAGNEALAADRATEFDLTFELPKARNGFGHLLGAGLLDTALREALRAVIADRRYVAILEKYGAEGAALTITP